MRFWLSGSGYPTWDSAELPNRSRLPSDGMRLLTTDRV